MGSGKTVVGRRLASHLRWKHVDLDREIERRSGKRVAEIFSTEGEAAFRALEVEVTPRFTALEQVVLSPGGGWITNPGLFESLPPGTLSVWLKVSPQEVVRRLTNSFSAASRPLLQGADPFARAEALLTQREPLYRRADLMIETESRGVEEIVQELTHIIRSGGDAPDRKRGS